MNIKTNFGETVGKVFGRWLILSERRSIDLQGTSRIVCDCRCSCGNNEIYEVRRDIIVRGESRSCGCITKELTRELGKSGKQYSEYDLSGEFGIGYTAKGEEFYFDLEDFDLIKNECWRLDKDGYVVTNKLKMHRIILGLTDKTQQVDHIHFRNNDNRKENIRVCSNTENNRNKKISKHNKSGIIGVSYESDRNKWKCTISFDGTNIIRRFDDMNSAILERLNLENELFKNFAPQKHLFKQYGID